MLSGEVRSCSAMNNLCLHIIILNCGCRLNITVSSSATERETPYRRTPQRGMKRKRQVIEEEFQKSAYQSTARSVGDIDIVEDCPEGKFVKLYNKSDKVWMILNMSSLSLFYWCITYKWIFFNCYSLWPATVYLHLTLVLFIFYAFSMINGCMFIWLGIDEIE